jgi:hypothetical protein
MKLSPTNHWTIEDILTELLDYISTKPQLRDGLFVRMLMHPWPKESCSALKKACEDVGIECQIVDWTGKNH